MVMEVFRKRDEFLESIRCPYCNSSIDKDLFKNLMNQVIYIKKSGIAFISSHCNKCNKRYTIKVNIIKSDNVLKEIKIISYNIPSEISEGI